jgi:hypothetical protein
MQNLFYSTAVERRRMSNSNVSNNQSPVSEEPWKVKGLYFEACNCESVCPCYTGYAPTYGYCEGNCAWHINEGEYGGVRLDDLNVLMAIRCNGHMRQTVWKCWFYLDDRANSNQANGLRQIFTAIDGGHLGKIFGNLWQVQSVELAKIELKTQGWNQKATIARRLGLAIGALKNDAGPTLCRIPNVAGVAATAAENWYDHEELKFDHFGKNALTTTFEYHSE